ncbi:MAG TPA: hypothetical protein DHV55_18510 [Clostridiaceae bacterium]|jgi:hypothetical protein|uniref:Membrane-spanning protein n=1 Tax=Lutispora saccharofermentans TaxID=3024236 RepID=A0ABT1NDR6_9FIRM|nr:hypothetical protein [Lutispora saccharofermentans]MCQ1529370.1 hypothetical protein [Lutispora saccharofermentans]HCJ59111.1 hypothetical protein [Clostridiaceae bacterium]
MRKEGQENKRNWKRIIGIILFITLVSSIAYTIVKIIVAPSGPIGTEAYEKVKSDYVLMLLQCILGLIVMAIPSIIERRWLIDIPNNMEVLYFIFLYCAIYLGEVRNFYYIIPFWDTILHAFSGAMLGALGFALVSILNDYESTRFHLSPFFIALFAFCFALTAGAIWEIYEYLIDGIFGLNMQKFALEDGTLLIGHEALSDTMKDIIVDAVSALIISVAGYFSIYKKCKDD